MARKLRGAQLLQRCENAQLIPKPMRGHREGFADTEEPCAALPCLGTRRLLSDADHAPKQVCPPFLVGMLDRIDKSGLPDLSSASYTADYVKAMLIDNSSAPTTNIEIGPSGLRVPLRALLYCNNGKSHPNPVCSCICKSRLHDSRSRG